MSSTSSSFVEEVSYRDVGVLAKDRVSKNILARLSSAQIRRFVSPFYRDPFIYSTTISRTVHEIKETYVPPTTEKPRDSQMKVVIRSVKTPPSPMMAYVNLPSRSKSVRTPSGSSSRQSSFFSYNSKRQRIAALIKRLRTPTQNMLLKALPEVLKNIQAVYSKVNFMIVFRMNHLKSEETGF